MVNTTIFFYYWVCAASVFLTKSKQKVDSLTHKWAKHSCVKKTCFYFRYESPSFKKTLRSIKEIIWTNLIFELGPFSPDCFDKSIARCCSVGHAASEYTHSGYGRSPSSDQFSPSCCFRNKHTCVSLRLFLPCGLPFFAHLLSQSLTYPGRHAVYFPIRSCWVQDLVIARG